MPLFVALAIAAALLLTACADQGSDGRLINMGAGGPSALGAESQPSDPAAPQAPTIGRVAGAYAKRRLAVQMIGACEKDPDPTGFFGSDIYDDCAPNTLEAIRAKVAATLTATGAFAGVGEGDLVLTVTLTKLMVDTGMGGFVGDMMATTKMSATYRLAEASGHTLASGTATIESGSDDPNQTWLRFANQLAANLLGPASGGAPVASASAPAAPPKFGVEVSDLAPSVASGLGRPGLTGAQVVNCLPGSAADRAGIRSGDMIYQFAGRTLADARSLVDAVSREPKGKTVTVKLLRGKQTLSLSVQL
jgi:hypothetical protein